MSEKGEEGHVLILIGGLSEVKVYRRCQTGAQFLPVVGLAWVESQMLGISVKCIDTDSLQPMTKCCGKTNKPGGRDVLRDNVGIAAMPWLFLFFV